MTGIFRPATDLNVYQSLINTIQQCTLPKLEYISVLAYIILFDSEYAFEVENIRTALFQVFVAKSGTKLQLSEMMATLINMSAFIQVYLWYNGSRFNFIAWFQMCNHLFGRIQMISIRFQKFKRHDSFEQNGCSIFPLSIWFLVAIKGQIHTKNFKFFFSTNSDSKWMEIILCILLNPNHFIQNLVGLVKVWSDFIVKDVIK